MAERSKNLSRVFRRFLALVVVVGLACPALAAKSYQIPSISVLTRVQPDGLLLVDEQIQYRFTGHYSYAFRTIPLLPGEEVSGISISEEGAEYRPADDESPSTFKVQGEDAGFEVSWYFQARNETRTFRMRYTIRGAVHRYPDIAELHYKFLGEGWGKRIGSLQARVELPSGTDYGSVAAWVGDPIRGQVQIEPAGIVFTARNWPRHSTFRGRVLFPASSVASLPVEGSRPMLLEIQEAEEQALAGALAWEARRQELSQTLLPWMVLFPLASFLVWYLLYLRHGRRYQVSVNVPPGQLPSQDPLFARWVRHRNVGGETLVATLFDLARRGYMHIQEESGPQDPQASKRKKSDYFFEFKPKPTTDLRPFERNLIDFASSQVGNSTGFRISDLKRVAKKQSSRFRKWFRRWSKSFEAQASKEGIFEPYPVGAMALNLLLGLFSLGVGAAVSIWTSSPTGIPAIILGGLQMALTGLLSRRTPTGERLFQEWTNFRRQVRSGDSSHMQLLETWDAALIAAVSLGLVKKFNRLLKEDGGAFQPVPWFVTIDGDVSGVDGLSASLQSMVSTVSSTTTAATGAAGVGAAASGGGGGGAG